MLDQTPNILFVNLILQLLFLCHLAVGQQLFVVLPAPSETEDGSHSLAAARPSLFQAVTPALLIGLTDLKKQKQTPIGNKMIDGM